MKRLETDSKNGFRKDMTKTKMLPIDDARSIKDKVITRNVVKTDNESVVTLRNMLPTGSQNLIVFIHRLVIYCDRENIVSLSL